MNSGSAYPHTADGTPVLDTAAPYAAGPNARSAPATTAGQEGVVGGGAGEIGEKAKHFFEQGLATVSVRLPFISLSLCPPIPISSTLIAAVCLDQRLIIV